MLLGSHMSIAGGVFKAIQHGAKAGCDVIQIFTKQASQWKARELTDDEIGRFRTDQKETGVKVVCAHNSYLINLASPDDALYDKSRESMKTEIERCGLLKIPAIVMHPGSHVGSGERTGLKRVAKAINRIFSELPNSKTTVCLESTSGQGTNLGYKFEQLASIIDMVEDKTRMGVCLDTCHIFSAGYAMQTEKEYKATIKEFNTIVGMKYLKIWHFNDSKKPFGERKDRHEHIGKGEMGVEPFRYLMNDRKMNRVPKILETPKGPDYKEDIENLKILRSMIQTKEKEAASK